MSHNFKAAELTLNCLNPIQHSEHYNQFASERGHQGNGKGREQPWRIFSTVSHDDQGVGCPFFLNNEATEMVRQELAEKGFTVQFEVGHMTGTTPRQRGTNPGTWHTILIKTFSPHEIGRVLLLQCDSILVVSSESSWSR